MDIPDIVILQIAEEPSFISRSLYESGIKETPPSNQDNGRKLYYPMNIVFTGCSEFIDAIRKDAEKWKKN